MHWNSQKYLKIMIIKVYHCPKCCLPQLYLADKQIQIQGKGLKLDNFVKLLALTKIQARLDTIIK